MKYILLISAFACIACTSIKNAAQAGQGLSGFVYSQSGNQMPAPNRPARKPKGLISELYIYQQTTTLQTEGIAPIFTKVKSKLIMVAHTDSSGHYAVSLPVGKYSVFIKKGEQFFVNESDGDGILNPVEVVAGKVTMKDWRLATRAVN